MPEECPIEIAKILLSSLVSYLALFLFAKLVGRKQIAQLNFLDYIAGITIGSITAEKALIRYPFLAVRIIANSPPAARPMPRSAKSAVRLGVCPISRL